MTGRMGRGRARGEGGQEKRWGGEGKAGNLAPTVISKSWRLCLGGCVLKFCVVDVLCRFVTRTQVCAWTHSVVKPVRKWEWLIVTDSAAIRCVLSQLCYTCHSTMDQQWKTESGPALANRRPCSHFLSLPFLPPCPYPPFPFPSFPFPLSPYLPATLRPP